MVLLSWFSSVEVFRFALICFMVVVMVVAMVISTLLFGLWVELSHPVPQDSLWVVLVDPGQQVAAVIVVQPCSGKLSEADRELLMVQAGVEVHDVYVGRVAVLHPPHHHQQVFLHTSSHSTHLGRFIKQEVG